MTTLDGVERSFDAETVLVCDRERPTGIAGIMGGQVSEVSAETTSVLLEAATWNGPNILRTSAMLGLRSEASARFEKQLHPELAMRAQRIASRLIVELAGATLVAGHDRRGRGDPRAPRDLPARRADRVAARRGDRARSGRASTSSGSVSRSSRAARTISRRRVPPDRHYDVTREVDLIEEVGRLHGFDRLPRTLPAHAERVGALSRRAASCAAAAEDVLRDLGFDEIVSWSFVAPELADRLRLPAGDPRRRRDRDREPDLGRAPADADDAARRPARRRPPQPRPRRASASALFESGPRLPAPSRPPAEGGPLAGAFAGRMRGAGARAAPARRAAGRRARPRRLGGGRRRTREDAQGFYALKGVLELLATALCGRPRARPRRPSRSCTRAAPPRVEVGGADGGLARRAPPARRPPVGPAGAAPRSSSTWRRCSPARRSATEALRGPDHPSRGAPGPRRRRRRRGRARSGSATRSARAAASCSRGAEVFDLYRGEQVGAGSKSLALRLEFRAPDRTLTDEEVAGAARARSARPSPRSEARFVSEHPQRDRRRRVRLRRRARRRAGRPPSAARARARRPRARTPASALRELYPRYRGADRR